MAVLPGHPIHEAVISVLLCKLVLWRPQPRGLLLVHTGHVQGVVSALRTQCPLGEQSSPSMGVEQTLTMH